MTGDEQRDVDLEFEGFFKRWYHNGVRFGCSRYGLQEWEAEAATSEAMAQLYGRWSETGGELSRKRLFVHILRRRCVDVIRAQIRYRNLVRRVAQHEVGEVTDSLCMERVVVERRALPEQAHDVSEAAAELAKLLEDLPTEQRLSITLEAVGYSTEERAGLKNITQNTERQHLYRGRRRLEQRIREREQEGAAE
ncbi:RNA polymerase sigma factor [Streptomyces virginiae]|uniref:RNA polymerase sigma factor n=1 Tax=Streptomyces virginiae TaxID=1961 RepID=UPI003653B0BE